MKLIRRGLKSALPLVILLAPVVFWINHRAIFDWYQLRNYIPSSSVSSLATSGGFNPSAKKIFYVNHPRLFDEIKQFRASCPSTEQTIILGCYHSNQAGIYIYNVKDARLSGIKEVTAAHEMLHAAYDRLSSKEKTKINSMLIDYYQNGLSDQRIKDTINEYKKSEPNDLVNEMHSIFGTEVVSLPSALENYYKQYFTNRSLVVGFSQNYEAEFSSRSAKTRVLEDQLNSLKVKIDSEEANLRANAAQIELRRTELDNLKKSNQVDAYNAQVGAFNSLVESYNASVNVYKYDVTSYNRLLENYNTIAGELSNLFDAIDTRVEAPATKVKN